MLKKRVSHNLLFITFELSIYSINKKSRPEAVNKWYHRYILYWGKLRHLKLQDYCVVVCAASRPGVAEDLSDANTYYLLCDKLPEDCKLRRSLMQMKLVICQSIYYTCTVWPSTYWVVCSI